MENLIELKETLERFEKSIVLKQVSDAASIANQISDLVRAWLSSNLEAAPGDSQLQAADCDYRIPDGDSIF